MEKNKLASNIKILREERRLSKNEFAEMAGVTLEKVNAWENGTLQPSTRELYTICPILRIHEEDILERDIASEREDAGRRMRQDKSRSNYNWYLGDRKKIAFFVGWIAVLLAVGFFGYYLSGFMVNDEIKELLEETGASLFLVQVSSLITPIGIANLVFILIYAIPRYHIQIKWWYILIGLSFSSILISISAVLSIPAIFFCLYQIIIKKGKN